ncbi:MAG: CPBP family glutamic-type intramembrane protease [Candidatus Asgardarchaeia archaeon]
MIKFFQKRDWVLVAVGTGIAIMYSIFVYPKPINATISSAIASIILINTMLLLGFEENKVIVKSFAYYSYRNLILTYFYFVLLVPLIIGFINLNFTMEYASELLLYLVIPTSFAVLVSIPRFYLRSKFFDLTLILFFIFVFDYRWFKHVFYINNSMDYALMSIYMVNLAIFIFYIMRSLSGIGYSLELMKSDLKIALKYLAVAILVLLPLATITNFVSPRTNLEHPALIGVYFVGIFLTIGIVEELAFRGILLNILSSLLNESNKGALIFSALIFGFSHYNNSLPNDFRYVFLATIAGIIYGLAYLEKRRLLPAILIHTAVDTIWKYFFV